VLSNLLARTSIPLHQYVLEKATIAQPTEFAPVSEPTTARSVTVENCCGDAAFFRVKLLPPEPRNFEE
jgi:hypothetical protein